MSELQVFTFQDVSPEVQACVQSCSQELSSFLSVKPVNVSDYHKSLLKNCHPDSKVWIVAQDWRSAIEFLGVRQSSVRAFVSVVSHQDKRLTPWETWFRAWSKPLPAHVTLIAHSPVSFRFLRELVGVPENQLELLPFPLPIRESDQKQSDFVVGTYGAFNSQANLHFVLTVAHYVTRRNPNIKFRIVGSGPLRSHLHQLCQDLDLGSQVTLIESMDLHYPNSFSISLDFSHHKDHFIPQLLAGLAGAVPICLETEGIAEYIKDSSNGFITSQDDTKNVGELILSLKNNPLLFQEMGRRHRQQMEFQFSGQQVAQIYLETFFEGAYQTMNFVRCAK